jgi:Uma2 family endonuclease
MDAMTVAQRMRAEEYLALDGPRFAELVEGEVVVDEPLPLHQSVAGALFIALVSWSSAASGRGEATLPIDVLRDEHNVFGPDVLWYREGRGPGRSEVRPQPLPDIAIEVRSPTTWRHDIGAKKSAYERRGLPELWLVDTAAAEILVFRRAGASSSSFDVSLELAGGETLVSPELPGFALALDELFP